MALAAVYLLTASAHWGPMRADLVRMVPPSLPNAELLVTITGVAEIAGAIGLLVPPAAPLAAIGLTLLLVAVFPANVHAAHAGLTLAGKPALGVVPRGRMQLLFLGSTVAAGFGHRWSASQSGTVGLRSSDGPRLEK